MANVLSLALRVTADASGLKLTPVERALKGLGDQADKLSGQFTKFSGDSDAAAAAQERFAKQSQDLINTLRSGGPEAAAKFAAEFEKLAAAADKEAAAFERAAKITEANLSNFERFTRTQRELKEQVDAGRISQETYNRAIEGAAKGLTDAERAAARLGASQKQIADSAASTTLKFNELSGVFAVLPGPLGSIAGRISGIASASQGLSRVFSGGLQAGIGNIASSLTSLFNPLTAAIAGIAALGTAAKAVADGLIALEDRVERLSRLATQLGVSFEFVQTLEEAGRRADVSIEQLSGSFARLQNTLAGADEESKKAATALERLGVSVTEFGALSQEQQIELIGEKLSQIEDPAQRSAAAIALFGRSGVQLLPFFNELELAASDMERFGRAVSDLDRQRLADFGASIDALGLSTQGLGTSLLIPFAGLAERIANVLAQVTSGITGILDPIGKVLEPILTNLGRAIQFVFTPLTVTLRVVGELLAPIGNLFATISEALEPVLDGLSSFVSFIADGIVQAVSFVASFSPLNAVAEVFRFLSDSLEPLFAAFSQVGDVVSRVVAIIQAAFDRLREIFQQTVGQVVGRIRELIAAFLEWTGISETIRQNIEILAKAFDLLYRATLANLDAIGRLVDNALTAAERFLGIRRDIEEPIRPDIDLAPLGIALEGELAKAQVSVAKFGQAGVEATLQFAAKLEEIAELVAEGVYDGEAEKRAIALATAEFERQRDVLEQIADDQKRAAEEAERRAKAQADAIQQIIDSSLELERIQQEFGGDASRFRAAENLLKLNEEIARVEQQLQAAREAGNQAVVDALTSRLATLDQVAARENDIASGARKQREEAAKAAERERERAAKAADDLTKKLFAEAQKRANAEVAARKKIEEAQATFRERQFAVDLARLEELNTVRTGSVEVGDIRSGGIGAFFATLREDPAVSEAKKQTAELTKLNKNIEKLEAQRVDILAGNG
jgi:phage-related protein